VTQVGLLLSGPSSNWEFTSSRDLFTSLNSEIPTSEHSGTRRKSWLKWINLISRLMQKRLNWTSDLFSSCSVSEISPVFYRDAAVWCCWLMSRSRALVFLLRQLLSQLQRCVCNGVVLLTVGGVYHKPGFPFMNVYHVRKKGATIFVPLSLPNADTVFKVLSLADFVVNFWQNSN